jgi:ATP adenylyltransferase
VEHISNHPDLMSARPLWAPWRIEYITSPKDDECIFCKAASSPGRDDSNYVIERGERCFSLLNAFPYAPGHLMVAPYRHVAGLDGLDEPETSETMKLARRGIAAMREAMNPDGFNVGFNLGKVAGAGIADHLHLHVVPRWEGDTNFMPVLDDIRVIPQALDASRRALIEALGQLSER